MSEKSIALEDYLNSFLGSEALVKQKQWPRVQCCGMSRSIYCSECFSVLIPKTERPEGLHPLPFQLDIILQDRRNVATGIHAKVLNKIFGKGCSERTIVNLIDIERFDLLPSEFSKHTYVLFPSDESVPLQAVRHVVQTLIVLDCKWTRSSSRHDLRLRDLPCVHLSRTEITQSYYWRWHSAGPQGLSTIEAIYEAAREVDPSRDWKPWLWLFGLQRAAAGGISHKQKQHQQALRSQKGTDKQAKDKELGKFLSEQHKRDVLMGKTMRQARKPQWQIHLYNQQIHQTKDQT